MPDASELEAAGEELGRVAWAVRALAELVGASTLRHLPPGLEPLLGGLADRLDAVRERIDRLPA